MDQFSDRPAMGVPTYPGALTVIRAMKVSDDGYIMSPARGHLWSPGPNLATCKTSPEERYMRNYVYFVAGGGPRVLPKEPPVGVAVMGCTCGFYAYFSEQNAHYYLPGRDRPSLTHPYGIYTICSAYGRMTVGTDGLRAEKMQIEAIVVKNLVEEHPEPQAPVEPKVVPRKWDLAMILPFFIVQILSGIFDSNDVLKVIALFSWTLWTAWLVLNIRDFRRMRRYRKALHQWNDEWLAWDKTSRLNRLNTYGQFELPEHVVEDMQEKYPGIPVYYSLGEALEKHPLSGVGDL